MEGIIFEDQSNQKIIASRFRIWAIQIALALSGCYHHIYDLLYWAIFNHCFYFVLLHSPSLSSLVSNSSWLKAWCTSRSIFLQSTVSLASENHQSTIRLLGDLLWDGCMLSHAPSGPASCLILFYPINFPVVSIINPTWRATSFQHFSSNSTFFLMRSWNKSKN